MFAIVYLHLCPLLLICFGKMCDSVKDDSKVINALVLINTWQFAVLLATSGGGRLCLLKWIRFSSN